MLKIDTSNDLPITPVLQEEFRSLFTSIEFSGADNKVICVSSSFPNEGKSYVAYQLAKVMADGNKKILLIDTDMRSSSFHRKLNFKKDMVGLSHVLTKQVNVNDALYTTSQSGFYFMPTGVFSNNPTALFRQEYFKAFIDAVREAMDYVIIDTPPVGMVTDGTIIANVSDASFLVVGSKMESRKTVKASIEAMIAANENFLGVVMNKMDSKARGYGRYVKYGKYGYGYGEGAKNGK